jgi:hypothetical protein
MHDVKDMNGSALRLIAMTIAMQLSFEQIWQWRQDPRKNYGRGDKSGSSPEVIQALDKADHGRL